MKISPIFISRPFLRYTSKTSGSCHISNRSSSWSAAIQEAESLVRPTSMFRSFQIQPENLLGPSFTDIPTNILSLIQSSNSILNQVASYSFQQQGKHFRPLIVLLMSQAVNATQTRLRFESRFKEDETINSPFNLDTHSLDSKTLSGNSERSYSSPLDNAPLFPSTTQYRPVPLSQNDSHNSESFNQLLCKNLVSPSTSPNSTDSSFEGDVPEFITTEDVAAHDFDHFILPSQRRLAEITEMIHTASLLHDDVIDNSDIRRGQGSVNSVFGNKLAILGGDFLLARASVALARLRNLEVVELLATVIETLVQGEIMQLSNKPCNGRSITTEMRLQYYLDKTYMKTGSLFARSCKASAILIGGPEEMVEMSYNFGKHLGLAFQIVDDIIDYTVTSQTAGKPTHADLKLGLATAPAIYASEEHKELITLMDRKFEIHGDIEKAIAMVENSEGLKRAKDLAIEHIDIAKQCIDVLPPSNAKQALLTIADKVLNREK